MAEDDDVKKAKKAHAAYARRAKELLYTSKATFVCGSDECGTGAWAGPLVVAAAVVPRDWQPPEGLTDSKKMTWAALTRVSAAFVSQPIWPTPGALTWWAVRSVSSELIDEFGKERSLYAAHQSLMMEALKVARALGNGADPLGIADGTMVIDGCVSLPKADLNVPVVSMASVIGKVARDRHMHEMGALYPGYGFEDHVGYGTEAHIEALTRLGVCSIHRRSYKPIADLCRLEGETKEAWLGLEEEP